MPLPRLSLFGEKFAPKSKACTKTNKLGSKPEGKDVQDKSTNSDQGSTPDQREDVIHAIQSPSTSPVHQPSASLPSKEENNNAEQIPSHNRALPTETNDVDLPIPSQGITNDLPSSDKVDVKKAKKSTFPTLFGKTKFKPAKSKCKSLKEPMEKKNVSDENGIDEVLQLESPIEDGACEASVDSNHISDGMYDNLGDIENTDGINTVADVNDKDQISSTTNEGHKKKVDKKTLSSEIEIFGSRGKSVNVSDTNGEHTVNRVRKRSDEENVNSTGKPAQKKSRKPTFDGGLNEMALTKQPVKMKDFIHFNPEGKPMSGENTAQGNKDEKTLMRNKVEEDRNNVGPRVMIDSEGRVIIDEASLYVSTSCVVNYDSDKTNNQRARYTQSVEHLKKWSTEDTEEFYRLLQKFGTDFTAIAYEMNIQRSKVVKKYHRELRTRKDMVEKAESGKLGEDEISRTLGSKENSTGSTAKKQRQSFNKGCLNLGGTAAAKNNIQRIISLSKEEAKTFTGIHGMSDVSKILVINVHKKEQQEIDSTKVNDNTEKECVDKQEKVKNNNVELTITDSQQQLNVPGEENDNAENVIDEQIISVVAEESEHNNVCEEETVDSYSLKIENGGNNAPKQTESYTYNVNTKAVVYYDEEDDGDDDGDEEEAEEGSEQYILKSMLGRATRTGRVPKRVTRFH